MRPLPHHGQVQPQLHAAQGGGCLCVPGQEQTLMLGKEEKVFHSLSFSRQFSVSRM